MLSPPITGPTGTKGGAKVGICPLPMTSITCCIGSHMRNDIARTVEMPMKQALYCLSLSSLLMPPSRLLSISCASVLGTVILAIIGDMQAMSGIGTLGMGGAIGPGKAANAGYHGRPGTVTLSCQSLKHFDTPAATASRHLAILPIIVAVEGAFLMLDSRSGPVRQPGVPIADTAMTWRFWNLAWSFHILCAKSTPSIIAIMKSEKPLPMVSQLFW